MPALTIVLLVPPRTFGFPQATEFAQAYPTAGVFFNQLLHVFSGPNHQHGLKQPRLHQLPRSNNIFGRGCPQFQDRESGRSDSRAVNVPVIAIEFSPLADRSSRLAWVALAGDISGTCRNALGFKDRRPHRRSALRHRRCVLVQPEDASQPRLFDDQWPACNQSFDKGALCGRRRAPDIIRPRRML